jgi:hypothetical protein
MGIVPIIPPRREAGCKKSGGFFKKIKYTHYTEKTEGTENRDIIEILGNFINNIRINIMAGMEA